MKTTLEMFKEIEDLDMPDGVGITVKDIVPFMCEKVELAIQRLETIENTFADSHICEIQKEFTKYDKLCEETKCEKCALGVGDGICLRKTFEKKWELQKKIVSPNSTNLLMQELDCKDFAELRKYARCGYEKINKNYLKWEDLEFGKTPHKLKAKMNDSLYRIEWFIDGGGFKAVNIYLYVTKDYLEFCTACNEQFFNDLHLERVENNE